jgi:hypothetical protein
MKELQMKRILRDERGMALALAIVALVIIGALVAGAFFAGIQEQRTSDNSRYIQQSFGVAEGGAYETIRAWDRAAYSGKPAYPADSAQIKDRAWTTMPNKTGSYGGYIYKLNNELFLIDVTGRDSMSRAGRVRGGGARQRIGIVARISPLQITVRSAVTAGGTPQFSGGDPQFNGGDSIPPGWASACPPSDTAKAGIVLKNAGDVNSVADHITGNPPIKIDPAMDTSIFNQYGPTSYAQLVAQANINLPAGTYAPAPVAVGGVCSTTVVTNWGDPVRTNPCGTYLPIIHIAGNATFSGGVGQGVLLVDGNLYASGNFKFNGLVIVQGQLTAVSGQSLKIYGALLAKSVKLPSSGGPVVNYSKCALAQSLMVAGLPAMGRSRSWVQLY